MRGLWLYGVLLCSCGRIGYDPRDAALVAADGRDIDAAMIATSDGPATDGAPDAPPTCPVGTTAITSGSSVCIEQAERGNLTWTNAKADCQGLGRRLCADAEWFTACTDATGMIDMLDLDWEWVAEETGGVAQKRGSTVCTDMSSHEIFVDPYIYRCCLDL